LLHGALHYADIIARREIITLPDGICPDYAEDMNCGTYSYPNLTLTANTTQGAAPNFWKTLQGFMGAFPDYSRNGFHFSSESYGGHYGPVFNEYIETQNAKKISGAHKISLETVLIGYVFLTLSLWAFD
jgi:carboxypeptidase D